VSSALLPERYLARSGLPAVFPRARSPLTKVFVCNFRKSMFRVKKKIFRNFFRLMKPGNKTAESLEEKGNKARKN